MNKRYRCGRLLLTSDGKIETIDLRDGGGIRYRTWLNAKMTFQDVHDQLLNLYKLDKNKHQTFLYDFELQRINISEYKTFDEYIQMYGLYGNSTAVYLCTHQDEKTINTENEISLIKQEQILDDHQQVKQSSMENSINDLMKNVRQLIDEDRFNKIFVELYENICTIYGYVFGMIIPFQQHTEQSDQLQLIHSSNNFNKIYQIFQSTETLFDRNMNNFRHVKMFSIVYKSFCQLYNKVQFLRIRSVKIVKNGIKTSSTSDDRDQINEKELSMITQSLTLEKSSNKQRKKIFSLFQSFLKHLNGLIQLTCSAAFHQFILLSIDKVNSIQSNINLSDQSCTFKSIDIISSIRNEFKEQFNQQNIVPSKSRADLKLFESCKMVLVIVRTLLISLQDIRFC